MEQILTSEPRRKCHALRQKASLGSSKTLLKPRSLVACQRRLKLVGNEAFYLPWLRETVKRFSAGIFFEWHSGSTIACVYFGLFLVALAQHEDVWEPERSKSDAREMEKPLQQIDGYG